MAKEKPSLEKETRGNPSAVRVVLYVLLGMLLGSGILAGLETYRTFTRYPRSPVVYQPVPDPDAQVHMLRAEIADLKSKLEESASLKTETTSVVPPAPSVSPEELKILTDRLSAVEESKNGQNRDWAYFWFSKARESLEDGNLPPVITDRLEQYAPAESLPLIRKLASYGDRPTLKELQDLFPAVEEALKAEEIRQLHPGWQGELLASFSEIVKIRRTRAAGSPEPLANSVQNGDIESALEMLDGKPNADQDVVQSWVDRATLYLEIRRTLDALDRQLMTIPDPKG
jgi:hypothetical protein